MALFVILDANMFCLAEEIEMALEPFETVVLVGSPSQATWMELSPYGEPFNSLIMLGNDYGQPPVWNQWIYDQGLHDLSAVLFHFPQNVGGPVANISIEYTVNWCINQSINLQ